MGLNTLPPHRTRREVLRLLICLLKGGPGKSTSVWNLALAFAMLGYRVVAIDADLKTASLDSWRERALRSGFVIPFIVERWDGREKLSSFCTRMEREHDADVVIVDTGGEHEEVFMSACLWADRLLMPCGTSLIEIERLHETKATASEIAAVSPITPSVLLTRVPLLNARQRGGPTGLASQARRLIEDEQPHEGNDFRPYDIHVMETEISSSRDLYVLTFGTVSEDPGEYKDLAAELDREMIERMERATGNQS